MTPSNDDSAQVALVALLDALASVLIHLEITPARLAQIARTSFVKAGSSQARMRTSGRPHLARIAALTGLTRLEVKKIVSSGFDAGLSDLESLPRALRVLGGWRNSTIYSRHGKPRKLRITGSSPSFYSLCKAFSGDIPHKVILDELVRQHRVVFTNDRRWVSIARPSRGQTKHRQEREALVFAAMFLTDALHPDTAVVRRRERIAATVNVSNAYVENAVAGRVTELLDQMPQVFGGGRGRKRETLNLYALLARSNPKR